MTQDQLKQIIIQLETATEILKGDAPEATKIATMERIGIICSYQSRKWADETIYKMLDL